MPTKPKLNQPETPTEVQVRDNFRTPRYATELLIPFIPWQIEDIYEPAAGEGHITKVLQRHGYTVHSADLVSLFAGCEIRNFLDDCIGLPPDTAIITNPPFSLKRKFYEKCRDYGYPFALLIPADYSGWIIEAIRYDGAQKIVPTRRIDYITPNGKAGKTSASQFHSMWLTWGFGLRGSETFVELTNETKKKNVI